MINKLQQDIIKTMKAKEPKRLLTLRTILSDIKKIALDDKRKEIKEEDMVKAIIKGIKQRKDSIEQFTKGNRIDLVEVEEFELKIYKEYEKPQLSEEDVRLVVEDVLGAVEDLSMSKMGLCMSECMKRLKGLCDGSVVKKLVINRLNE